MSGRLEEMLVDARSGLHRLEPQDAARAVEAGALLVDTRSDGHRRDEGAIPGAVVIDRNKLEWRLDPEGEHRTPHLRDATQVVVIVCDEGYASSLAAATLQSLGLVHATDLVGGFRAWAAAGLPVEPAG